MGLKASPGFEFESSQSTAHFLNLTPPLPPLCQVRKRRLGSACALTMVALAGHSRSTTGL